MRSRWLSTFTVIGMLLIGLGVVGLCLGRHFVFDPGQLPDQAYPWYVEPGCYVIIGLLMVANGVLLPVGPQQQEKKDIEPRKHTKVDAPRSNVRETISTATDSRGRE